MLFFGLQRNMLPVCKTLTIRYVIVNIFYGDNRGAPFSGLDFSRLRRMERPDRMLKKSKTRERLHLA